MPSLVYTPASFVAEWTDACALDLIPHGTGVAALIRGEAVAIFRIDDSNDGVRVVGNIDPFMQASVIARGLTGCRKGEPFVASPMLKHAFSLNSGEHLDDRSVRLPVYAARVFEGRVQVGALRS